MEENRSSVFIIPTRHKAKIPKFLSYPVGAQLITEALNGIQQLENFELYFTGSKFAIKQQNRGEPYSVVEVEYKNYRPSLSTPNFFIEKGWYKDKWEITIYPVPTEQKFKIKSLLLEFGLPNIKVWLQLNNNSEEFEGYKRYTILYAEKNCSLKFSEFINR